MSLPVDKSVWRTSRQKLGGKSAPCESSEVLSVVTDALACLCAGACVCAHRRQIFSLI